MTRPARRLLTALTVARILLAPAIMAVVLVAADRPWLRWLAAVLFAVAASTDFADGRLARRWGLTSTLGAFLDTTADKVLITGVLFALVAAAQASPWVAAIIVVRELLVLALRGVVALDGTLVTASVWGKLKTNVQFLAITLAVLVLPLRLGPWRLDEWAMGLAGVVTILSGWDYLRRFSSSLTNEASAR